MYHGDNHSDIRHRGVLIVNNIQADKWPPDDCSSTDHHAVPTACIQRDSACPVLDGFDEWHDTGGNGDERSRGRGAPRQGLAWRTSLLEAVMVELGGNHTSPRALTDPL